MRSGTASSNQQPTTNSLSSTITALPPQSTSSGSSRSPTLASTATTPTPSDTRQELSQSDKINLGVGLGVGLSMGLLGAVLAYLAYREQRRGTEWLRRLIHHNSRVVN
jgi:hypothetical protein